jgi:hypothetical protein
MEPHPKGWPIETLYIELNERYVGEPQLAPRAQRCLFGGKIDRTL